MATNIKNKEIQVQKPAQSLQAFQAKIAAAKAGQEISTGLLKPILISASVVVVLILGWFAFAGYRASIVEKHETALAQVLEGLQGEDAAAPLPPAEMEKRMRERLPQLEKLARTAPSACRAATQGVLNMWKLQLDGSGVSIATGSDPWSKLRLAQRQIALGQGTEALATLTPLRKSATPSQVWANLYWTTLIDARRVVGDRDSAWKDFAEYKSRFREQGDAASLERTINGI